MNFVSLSISILLFFTTASVSAVGRPKVQPGEMAVYFKESYHIFKVREFKKLKLSENCFHKSDLKKKNHIPKCQSYDVAQIKVKDIISKIPGQTHPASMHCSRMMGENLIAFDSQNNQYDYCRFPDNSLVSSWSMFNNAYVGEK